MNSLVSAARCRRNAGTAFVFLALLCGARIAVAQGSGLQAAQLQSGGIMLTGRSIPPPNSELNNLKALWAAKRWSDLANAVVQSGHNIDILWFYLGEAANGLGYIDAAKVYYARAQDLATDTDKTHKCAFYTKGAFLTGTDFCSGFKFPDDITTKVSPPTPAQAAPQVANASATSAAPVTVNMAELETVFTTIGYVMAAANTCGWPLPDKQKQNASAFMESKAPGLTTDQHLTLQYDLKDGYRTISKRGRLDFCEDDAEHKKYNKRVAELWPSGPMAAPGK